VDNLFFVAGVNCVLLLVVFGKARSTADFSETKVSVNMSAFSRAVLRKSSLFAILFSGTFLATACNSDSSTKSVKFLWLPKELNNEVFWTGRTGAVAKADDISKLKDPDVEIIYKATESAKDVEGQADILLSAKELGVDAVAISCNSGDGLKNAIDTVTSDGIPVMTFDSDSPDSSRFTYLGVDNEAGGKVAARLLGKSMANTSRKKIAVISGVKGAANLESRVNGFKSEVDKLYPDFEVLEPVYCNDDGYAAATLIEKLISEHADIGGVFFVGLWPLFACEETDCTANMPGWSEASLAGDIKTVAFDTLDFELAFVENGMISGLVGQKYWGWGFDATQMMYDHVVDGKKFDSFTNSGIDVVCPNNVDEMSKMWSELKFTSPLSPCTIDGETIE
jgi:ribose transport system substrate-binding protein